MATFVHSFQDKKIHAVILRAIKGAITVRVMGQTYGAEEFYCPMCARVIADKDVWRWK